MRQAAATSRKQMQGDRKSAYLFLVSFTKPSRPWRLRPSGAADILAIRQFADSTRGSFTFYVNISLASSTQA